MSDELKPCPFCGGRAELRGEGYSPDYVAGVSCKCGAGILGQYQHEAVAAWNTRTDLADALTAALEEIASYDTGATAGLAYTAKAALAAYGQAQEAYDAQLKAEAERDAANALLRQIADLTSQHGGAAQALKLIRAHLGANP